MKIPQIGSGELARHLDAGIPEHSVTKALFDLARAKGQAASEVLLRRYRKGSAVKKSDYRPLILDAYREIYQGA